MDELRERADRDAGEEDEYPGDYDVGEAFGDHNIEHWIYDGRRLVPASPDEEERLRDWWAMRRMQTWQKREQQRARSAARRAQWAWLTGGLASIRGWRPRHMRAPGDKSSRGALATAQETAPRPDRSASGASESAEP